MPHARVLLAFLALSVAAACSGQSATPGPTVPPVCVAIVAVYAQIGALQALDPATATADQVNDAVNNLASSWVNLRAEAQAMSQEGYTALDQAINRLTLAAAALPPSMSPAEKLAELQDEIEGVAEGAEVLQTDLGCPDL